ncbi:MAG: hypothetical protein Q8928_10265 [Bacteroidota bacterium]|nr:hypothetical protein [Bacteroidota bacterium]
MCRIKLLVGLSFVTYTTNIFSQVIPTNSNPVALEHNLLFNATTRYTVTQSGQAQVDLNIMFDGVFAPSYSSNAVLASNPTVITIEGLPIQHVQRGAWIGWTTRYWPSTKFKIEGYLEWSVSNGSQHWITITEQENYSGNDFLSGLPEGAYSKIRFTFYAGSVDPGSEGRFGLSEIYFIHPEATTPYNGLFEILGASWNKNGNNLNYNQGNVLIGKTSQSNSSYKLDVAGKIRTDEIVVNTTGADFVFEKNYKLRPLSEVETFIKRNKHLPDVAPAKEMQTNGVSMGDMQAKLLQKVEELTLYTIELEKKMKEMQNKMNELEKKEKL